jgi:calcineurin-like phosphoesterase family protein
MDWFTSDTHFGHANVIKYCARPFADVEEMNRTMIERWNVRVKPEDTVYHLGDFAMGPVTEFAQYARALNGRKILVLGNHDRGFRTMRDVGFDEVYRKDIYKGVFLRHHPQTDHLDALGFKVQFCGHVHEKWLRKKTPGGGLIVNVGVDQHGFQPITFEEALASG